VTAKLLAVRVYAPKIGEAHRAGDFHIHDLDMWPGTAPAGPCERFNRRGLQRRAGQSRGLAAQHLSSAVGQMVNFLGTLQNEWAGAQAFSSFDTYLAPFVRKGQPALRPGAAEHPGVQSTT